MSRQPTYTPERGDLVWIDFDPQAGHEQAGRRPALVLSPSKYNGRVGMAVCCPVTQRRKGYGFEVALPDGLAVQGVVLVDQLKCVDWKARGITFVGTATAEVMRDVTEKLMPLLTDE